MTKKTSALKKILYFSCRDQLEDRLERMIPLNPNYKLVQRQLLDIMEKLSKFSNDSNSSF